MLSGLRFLAYRRKNRRVARLLPHDFPETGSGRSFCFTGGDCLARPVSTSVGGAAEGAEPGSS
jgi:hypothetical protein